MTDTAIGTKVPKASVRRAGASNLYRAVWRWHFYAGLLVLPFMIALSVSGAIYLFKDEVDQFVHADFMRVVPIEAARLTPDAIVAAALTAQPGKAVKYTDPVADTLSTEITVQSETSGNMAVYVNQYTGKVLEVRPDRSTISWTVRYLHSFKFFGQNPRMMIEIAAGWSVLLVLTGIYLWWPRGQNGGVVTIRSTPKRRVFWRDLHAVTGIFVGGFIVFLAITGMPWSSVWGGKVNQWANGSNFGYPAGLRIDVPMSDEHINHIAPTSWSLEQAQIPQVPSHHMDMDMTPIGLDAAVATFTSMGLHHGFAVVLPLDEHGVYSGSVYPDDLRQQRVVHLDQYTGQPLVDMSYADYGPLGRWLEFGINTHMGQTYGVLNQYVLLAACIGIVLLAVSAAVMWWKRRPSGSFGVPPLPSDTRSMFGVVVILAIGGAVFPLTGMTLIVMVALDLLWQKMRAKPNIVVR